MNDESQMWTCGGFGFEGERGEDVQSCIFDAHLL